MDKGKEKGITVEYMREFERFLNQGVKRELDKIRIVLIPTPRNELVPGIAEGRGDIAAANLTITPERLETIDFSDPVLTGVRELVLTRKEASAVTSLSALSGLTVHLRRSSSYFASLNRIQGELAKQSLKPVEIKEADELLEDEDLIEMVHTGILPAIVMDEHKAKLWLKLYDGVKMHEEFAVREGGEIAWAIRKKSPQLKKMINKFLKGARAGTTLGNILFRRYYSDVNHMINPNQKAYDKLLKDLNGLFQKYGEKYSIDPMLLAALAFQESRFNNAAKSRTGAVGIMQMLPSTARDKNVNIKNFSKLERNIEAGAKYLRFVADQYFAEKTIPDLERLLFVFASYNAGPNKVAQARKAAKDSNKWFGNVEWEVARLAGAEPVKYVKNIYIYYLLFSNFVKYEAAKQGKDF
ncbi:MAG: transglycosylase SLT domain-containing protein [Hyphomicrobiales bacterium]